MTIAEQLFTLIKQKYAEGMTQQEIAGELGISQQHLNSLLCGKRKIDGLAIRVLNKICPNATLNLNGDSVSISAESNSGTVVGINTGTIGADCLSAISDKILMDEDLTAEEKIKFMKFLKK